MALESAPPKSLGPACASYLLALVGLPVGRFGGVGVGEVLGGDVHADALCRETAAGDADGFEESHQAGGPPSAERMMVSRAPAAWVSAW